MTQPQMWRVIVSLLIVAIGACIISFGVISSTLWLSIVGFGLLYTGANFRWIERPPGWPTRT